MWMRLCRAERSSNLSGTDFQSANEHDHYSMWGGHCGIRLHAVNWISSQLNTTIQGLIAAAPLLTQCVQAFTVNLAVIRRMYRFLTSVSSLNLVIHQSNVHGDKSCLQGCNSPRQIFVLQSRKIAENSLLCRATDLNVIMKTMLSGRLPVGIRNCCARRALFLTNDRLPRSAWVPAHAARLLQGTWGTQSHCDLDYSKASINKSPYFVRTWFICWREPDQPNPSSGPSIILMTFSILSTRDNIAYDFPIWMILVMRGYSCILE